MSSRTYLKQYGHFVVLALVLIGGVTFAANSAVINPPANPPTGNVSPLVDIGSADEFKTYTSGCASGNCGGFSVGKFFGWGTSHFFGNVIIASKDTSGANMPAGPTKNPNLFLTQYADGAKDPNGTIVSINTANGTIVRAGKIDRLCADQSNGNVIPCVPVSAQCGTRNNKSYYTDGSALYGPQWSTTTDTLCAKGTATNINMSNQTISWVCAGEYEGTPLACKATQLTYVLPPSPTAYTSVGNSTILVPPGANAVTVDAWAGGGDTGNSYIASGFCSDEFGGGGGSGGHIKMQVPMTHGGQRIEGIEVHIDSSRNVQVGYFYNPVQGISFAPVEPYLYHGQNGGDSVAPNWHCGGGSQGAGGSGGGIEGASNPAFFGTPLIVENGLSGIAGGAHPNGGVTAGVAAHSNGAGWVSQNTSVNASIGYVKIDWQ